MSTPSPALRIDARRNRERLLAAAAQLFEEKGAAFSVDEAAARAGVGTGTFYRNFPTKTALLSALVAQQLDELATQPVESDGDAAEAVLRFVRDAITGSRRKHDLVVALEAAGYTSADDISEASTRFRQRIGDLLARAQETGAVRGDLGLEDLLALVSAASASASRDGVSAQQVAAVITDGLRATPT
ncbi:helix-turn-helix domain-containing protein [Kribbella lupini]|uniref:TetR/AcrR family transcriptional regulator n=1 Tax=Kribbella lupini TaxID=291602 RepID=A0ABN2C1Z4_9ACTN